MAAPYTRLSPDGYGARRYAVGGFTGKTPDVPSVHPVGVITRLSLDGYGVRRYAVGGFAGKTVDTGGGGAAELPHQLPLFATPGRLKSF